jgi:hypothetical protein
MTATPNMLSLGIDVLAQKAREGHLTAENIWLAMKGAAKYRAAMLLGDVASPELAALRAGMQCANCPSIVWRDTGLEVDGGLVFAGSCGALLEEHLDGPKPTCGCLVSIRVNGTALPAGKTMVKSEKCPQRNW